MNRRDLFKRFVGAAAVVPLVQVQPEPSVTVGYLTVDELRARERMVERLDVTTFGDTARRYRLVDTPIEGR